MGTIKSRWNWVRAEICTILVLLLIVSFPSLPSLTVRIVADSQIYQSGREKLREGLSRLKPVDATANPAPLMKGGSNALVENDSMPLPEESGADDQITLADLAQTMILERTNPDAAMALYTKAAENGNKIAQYRILKMKGVDLDDLELYLNNLYLHHVQHDITS